MSDDGYIYPRGKVFWGRIRLAGREHRRSLRTNDIREAKRRLKAWRLKIERQVVHDGNGHTWAEAVTKWGEEVLPRAVKPAVKRRYQGSIANLDPIFRKLKVEQITSAHVAEFVSFRAGKVSNATIRRDLTALSRLLAACQAWGWINTNPAHTYDRSAILREIRDPITPPIPQDFKYLLSHAPEPMASILRLLFATGMRAQEVVKLEASDLDRKAQTITLTRTKTNRPRTLKWRTPGINAAPLLVGLPARGPLYPARDGAYKNFSSAFGALCRRIEARAKKEHRAFRRFRVHDLRHWFAIRWLRAGGDIYTLSKHLGHTSVRTTEIYLAFLTGDKQSGAQTRAQKPQKQKLENAKKAS